MPFRITAAAAVVALVIVAATGCTSPPSPTSTPTPTFTSADQAYAAAEKTYRAYVDALNEVDLRDPKTFEAVYAWTTGDALEGDKKSFTSMHADGWHVSGETVLGRIRPVAFELSGHTRVTARVCLDVSRVKVVDLDGDSVVPNGRNDRQPVTVTFTDGSSRTGLLIATSDASTDGEICGGH
ncbi:MAG: hypothetical protein J0I70_07025 [Microbacterium sp.]|uniref:hypothetical protein n=1 Tax=Microbacterium sp. TaxID=51671 RepID=UPI001ACC14DF|nr:hypothetical protein [Microbacterium sp.]MBN9173890.1 hypothetical protein [Microbacterium sp.]MBN9186853.1 hypothetical protein [Microbacterium sp.]MBN9191104.1 hypothetical protein [Microbacterium sp.]